MVTKKRRDWPVYAGIIELMIGFHLDPDTNQYTEVQVYLNDWNNCPGIEEWNHD